MSGSKTLRPWEGFRVPKFDVVSLRTGVAVDASRHRVIQDRLGGVYCFEKGSGQITYYPATSTVSPGRTMPVWVMPANVPERKQEKEFFIGRFVEALLNAAYGATGTLSANPNDPPDLIYRFGDNVRGIELCELVHPERYAIEKQLQQFSTLMGKIVKGEDFSKHRVLLQFNANANGRPSLPSRSLLPRIMAALREVLVDACNTTNKGETEVLSGSHIPKFWRPYLVCVMISYLDESERSDASCTLKIPHGQVITGEKLWEMIRVAVDRKMRFKLDKGKNVLLLWTSDPCFGLFVPQLAEMIAYRVAERLKECVAKHQRSPFSDVFYVHRGGTDRDNVMFIMVKDHISQKFDLARLLS
jgi:hypothetical protein